jgi:serine/threonine protein kinase
VLPADKVADASRRERFLREARAASALNHPNIVTIYDILSQDGDEFLVMEFISGQTVGGMLTRGPMPVSQALEIGAQIADALAAAHEAGIVHRDLKPGNVMLTSFGHVKLLDFGLAKLRSDPTAPTELADTTLLTGDGRVLGTPAYMSPEQGVGGEVDARSDLFSLGVMLYEMHVGQPTKRRA